MKKLIAIIMAAALLLGLAACGSINKTEVSVLWSGDGIVKVPNSLINAMERAMYIESISYKHYGANGDQAAQTKQAEDALNAGCAALAVELVDPSAAQTIADLAKAKNVPVVFFNTQVDEAVVSGYDKCVAVSTDVSTLGTVQGDMISQYLEENLEKADRNGDGNISYVGIGDVAATVAAAGDKLEAVEAEDVAAALADHSDEAGNMIELVITDSDAAALEALAALQEKDYNTNKLTTHCIPLFTVGADADASAFTDTSNMTEEELAVFIYNAMNVIDAGQIAGTAVEDYDSIAISVASVLRSLLKNEPLEKNMVAVPYTTYTG